MTSSAPDRSGRHWERQAAGYDARTAGVERRFLADSRRWVGERVSGTTLEVAVGTGANVPYYPAGIELTGVDRSPQMLRVAARRASDASRPVHLCAADAAALPFASESFDTVVCTFALCCIGPDRAALAEAVRVLRPGGSLLLADHVAATSWPLLALQHVVERITVPLQGEHFTRRPALLLPELGMAIEESQRQTHGAIERVHARRPR